MHDQGFVYIWRCSGGVMQSLSLIEQWADCMYQHVRIHNGSYAAASGILILGRSRPAPSVYTALQNNNHEARSEQTWRRLQRGIPLTGATSATVDAMMILDCVEAARMLMDLKTRCWQWLTGRVLETKAPAVCGSDIKGMRDQNSQGLEMSLWINSRLNVCSWSALK